jgi:hypothetical protein
VSRRQDAAGGFVYQDTIKKVEILFCHIWVYRSQCHSIIGTGIEPAGAIFYYGFGKK